MPPEYLLFVAISYTEDTLQVGWIAENTKKHDQKHGNNRIPYRTLPKCIKSKPAHKIVKDKVALFGGNHRHSLFFNHPDKNLIPDSFTESLLCNYCQGMAGKTVRANFFSSRTSG